MLEKVVAKIALWRVGVGTVLSRNRVTPAIEYGTLAVMLIVGLLTTWWFSRAAEAGNLVSPFVVVLLLLANIAPAIFLIVLVGLRIARRRALQSKGVTGQLHVRLVSIFSLVATVPMVVMLILASLLFQYAVDIWYSNRARQMFENTTALSQQLYGEKQQRVIAETNTMAGDLVRILQQTSITSREFINAFFYQVYRRELSEAVVISITKENGVQSLALVNPYSRSTENWISPQIAQQMLEKPRTVFGDTGQRMEAIAPLPGMKNLFLYASRVSDPQTLARAKRASVVLADYNAMIKRSGQLQVILNMALYLVSILIMAVAVWVALRVADRLVQPVGELVGAARQIAKGDLEARVTQSRSRDEVGVLSRAFNRMADRLGEQNRELVASNDLLDRRRALNEAVLSSVSAGVIAVDRQRAIRIANPPASELLNVARDAVAGKALDDLAPELANLLQEEKTDGIVQVAQEQGARTLAVKIAHDEVGAVLTFDDITQQLSDQRRAAWSDVARRVAHEIKNPLTPIQLAAERLQRRFSREIESDQPAFERLTDTIVRQVGDLRRIVDEFSSFARMPKPVFAKEQLVDVVREAVFLHEVANPQISFKVVAPVPSPQLVCDRRQLAQAVSNIVKNAVEAIEQKDVLGQEVITVSLAAKSKGTIELNVADTGIGLPEQRDRIVEPYMTTRAGGTGLGLAIVSKILEEHAAQIDFADNPGGGTIVTIRFDAAATAASAQRFAEGNDEATDSTPIELTRARRR